jgi:hypothetical protein
MAVSRDLEIKRYQDRIREKAVSLMFGDEDAKLTPLKCSEMNK